MSSRVQPSSINSGTTQSRDSQKMPSADIAMRAIGRGLSLAVFYFVIFGSLLTDTNMPDSERVACSCVGIAIALCLDFLCMRFPTIIKTERLLFGVWIPTLGFVAIGVWSMIATYFHFSQGIMSFILYGLGALYSGYIVMVSARYELVYDKNTVASRCGASFLVFGIVMVISFFLNQFTLGCLTMGCSLAIACVNSIVIGGGQSDAGVDAKRKAASSLKLHWHSLISYGITSMVLCFEILCMPANLTVLNALILIGIGALGAVVACVIIGRVKGDAYFLQGPVGRITMPILIGAILLAQVFPSPYSIIPLIVVFITLFMRDLARVITRVLLAYEYDVSLSWLSAKTLMPWMSGFFLGALGAFFVTLWINTDTSGVQLFGAIVASVCIAIGEALAPYGTDPLTMPVTINNPEIKQETDDGKNKKSYWNVALTDLAESAALTAREREVLVLLSRGRSANVIAERLNISINTVKTHIYNIYRKTEMNNQQELIDEIENRRKLLLKALEEPQERL